MCAYQGFPEPKVMSPNFFFGPAICPKSKDSSFTIIIGKEKQQLLTFMKLEPGNIGHLTLIIKIADCFLSID